MTQPNDDPTSPEMFTRDQVRKMIGAEVRKVRGEFSDYAELKTRAEAADQDKGKIDTILEKLAASEKRSAEAEAAIMRREVADELGLTAAQARRLTGATREALLADGEELIETMGIKPKTTPTPKDDDQDGRDGRRSGAGADEDQDRTRAQAQEPVRRRATPREDLQSGAPRTETKPEETDPLKLAALIPRR